jgi:hypothetical protein
MTRLIACFAVLFTLNGISQEAPPKQNDVAQYVQHLMDIQVAFEDMVAPGVTIAAKEISRKGSSGKDLVVQYHIFVTGVPPQVLFKEMEWPVNQEKPTSPLEGISVGKDGILMCAGRTEGQCGDPKKLDDPIEFITIPRRGEPTRLAFISPTVKVAVVLIPDPVQASDRGCTISAVRLVPKFDLAFVSGSGYPPNADIHYRYTTEMTSDHVIKSDANGKIRLSLIPFPGKKTQGTATLKITEDKCSPEISYQWGVI